MRLNLVSRSIRCFVLSVVLWALPGIVSVSQAGPTPGPFENKLFQAVQQLDIESIQLTLLEHPTLDLTAVNEHGFSFIGAVLQRVLDTLHEHQKTPLDENARKIFMKTVIQVLQLLVDCGADVNQEFTVLPGAASKQRVWSLETKLEAEEGAYYLDNGNVFDDSICPFPRFILGKTTPFLFSLHLKLRTILQFFIAKGAEIYPEGFERKTESSSEDLDLDDADLDRDSDRVLGEKSIHLIKMRCVGWDSGFGAMFEISDRASERLYSYTSETKLDSFDPPRNPGQILADLLFPKGSGEPEEESWSNRKTSIQGAQNKRCDLLKISLNSILSNFEQKLESNFPGPLLSLIADYEVKIDRALEQRAAAQLSLTKSWDPFPLPP